MSSETKIDANRRNALKSTGPSTLRGKQLSRMNALRTGVHAKTLLLPGENAIRYEKIRNAAFAELQPLGIIERMLADQIAADMWRLIRIDDAERAYLEDRLIVHAYLREETEEMRRRRVGWDDGPETVYFEPNALDYKLSTEWREDVEPNAKDVSAVLARTVLAVADRETTAVIEARRRGLLRDVQRNVTDLKDLQKERLKSPARLTNGSEPSGHDFRFELS